MTLNRAWIVFDRRSLRRAVVLLGVFCCLLMPYKAWAQQAQAAINGTVHDTSGAVVPDASVVLHNIDTHLDRKTTTNSVGAYSLTGIQPGNYNLTVSKEGFTTSEQQNITLVVNQTATFDVTLKTGAMS